MDITWEVDDGYVGKAAPHYLTIDDADFEGCTESEREELIEELIQVDFLQKVSWVETSRSY